MTSLLKRFAQLLKKPTALILIVILVLASFLRLFRLSQNVMFEGDQGRDAIVVSRIFKELDPVFIGPVTSVGNMYLGPFYYYFMMPFLWLTYPSPLGPVYAVAIVNIIAVYLIYRFGSKMFNSNSVGLLAAFFMGLSVTAVTYSRFSWNPNLAPLLGLLLFYLNYKALKKPKYWLWVLTCGALLIQLHYLTLLALATTGVSWLWQLEREFVQFRAQGGGSFKKFLNQIKPMLTWTGVGLLVFALSLIPLMLFDYKHGWLNLKAFAGLVSSDDNFVQASERLDWLDKIWLMVQESEGRAMHILFEITIGKWRLLNKILVMISLAGLLWQYFLARKNQDQDRLSAITLLILYLALGIIGTATYQHTVFDHYIGYLYPITFITYALLLEPLSKRWLTLPIPLAFSLLFLQYNLPLMPLHIGSSLSNSRSSAFAIKQRLRPNETYDLVLLSQTKDLRGMRLRYFLQTLDQPPVSDENKPNAQALVIVNEEGIVNPLDLPIYEITTFPSHQADENFITPSGEEVLILRR